MMDDSASQIETTEATEEREKTVTAIGFSIVAYMLVAGLAVALLPDNPVATHVGVVVSLSFASMTLSLFYPQVLSLKIPTTQIIGLAILLGVTLMLLLAGLRPDPHYAKEFYSLGAISKMIYLLLACVVSPLAEEIYFRGLLLPILTRRFGVLIAVFVTITLFVVNHGRWSSAVLSLGAQGALYTWVAIRTNTAASSAVTHIAYNSIWFLITLLKH